MLIHQQYRPNFLRSSFASLHIESWKTSIHAPPRSRRSRRVWAEGLRAPSSKLSRLRTQLIIISISCIRVYCMLWCPTERHFLKKVSRILSISSRMVSTARGHLPPGLLYEWELNNPFVLLRGNLGMSKLYKAPGVPIPFPMGPWGSLVYPFWFGTRRPRFKRLRLKVRVAPSHPSARPCTKRQ